MANLRKIPIGTIAKYTLPALGIGGAGAAGGYATAKKKSRKQMKELSSKAVSGLRGQQRHIHALARQNKALKDAVVTQRAAFVRHLRAMRAGQAGGK